MSVNPNDVRETMLFAFVGKTSANGGAHSNSRSDYRTSDVRVSPTISEALNFKFRFRDYRDGNEAHEEEEEELKQKHESAAAGGRFRSDLFRKLESRLSNVNFGCRY